MPVYFINKKSILLFCYLLFFDLSYLIALENQNNVNKIESFDLIKNLDVKVKQNVWVSNEKVFLHDIAVINAPAYLNKKIRNIYIVQAPKPGKEITLKGSWIKSKVISDLKENQVNVTVPEEVVITRAWQEIEDKVFYDLFNKFLNDHISKNTDFEIKRFKVMGNHLIPAGKPDIEIVRHSQGQIKGYVSLNAIVKVNGSFAQKVIITAWIDRFESVVCSSRRIKRNEILSEDDYYIEKRNVSRINDPFITNSEEVKGKRIKRATESGAIITYKMIEKPPIIKKGDKVTIVFESKNIVVKAVGIAQSKGYKGDQITVKNSMSNKNVQATVIDENTVSVMY